MNERELKTKYMDWLWRLHAFGIIEQEDVDREGGRLYKFPKCCIENFITLTKAGVNGVGIYMQNVYGVDNFFDNKDNPRVRCAKCRGLITQLVE